MLTPHKKRNALASLHTLFRINIKYTEAKIWTTRREIGEKSKIFAQRAILFVIEIEKKREECFIFFMHKLQKRNK